MFYRLINKFCQKYWRWIWNKFTDKLDVKYKIGDDINTANLNEFKKICGNIDINDELIVFNNLVKNIDDFEKNWEVDIRKSWHKRFLTNV